MAPFTWNIPQWIARQVPVELRQVAHLDWLRAILDGVSYLYQTFFVWMGNQRYEQQLDGTVWQLERVLNDRYDRVLRRIRVRNTDRTYRQFWKLSEGPDVQFWKIGEGPDVQFWTQGEVQNEFIVRVPVSVWVTVQATRPFAILGTINRYKTVGPTYRVLLF